MHIKLLLDNSTGESRIIWNGSNSMGRNEDGKTTDCVRKPQMKYWKNGLL